jgi:meso-butanediol dehydrogenase / (S,S)-butanediol dehydrogenase / diacetyl reductase
VVELPEEAWHVILETNLTGTYLCSRAVARLMVARSIQGRIINMSSNCGKVGYARLAAYCASKFGVIGFTQALAMELAPHGITVNAICPGSADTDRLDFLGRRPDGSYDEGLRAKAIAERSAQIPLQRVATAEDVAELTAFLGSDAAGYAPGRPSISREAPSCFDGGPGTRSEPGAKAEDAGRRAAHDVHDVGALLPRSIRRR